MATTVSAAPCGDEEERAVGRFHWIEVVLRLVGETFDFPPFQRHFIEVKFPLLFRHMVGIKIFYVRLLDQVGNIPFGDVFALRLRKIGEREIDCLRVIGKGERLENSARKESFC